MVRRLASLPRLAGLLHGGWQRREAGLPCQRREQQPARQTPKVQKGV